MKSMFVPGASAQCGLRALAVSWGIVAMGFSEGSYAYCEIEQLQGKAYINLPKNLCPQYTDVLLGQTEQRQAYGGVICDRPEGSYILLQKLLRYTDQGKAVWQVMQIKEVTRPNPQSQVRGLGCIMESASSNPRPEPIFALVQPTGSTLQTLAAWKVNLTDALFTDLEPQQVNCNPPLLP